MLFGGLGDGLERDPQAGKARHGDAGEAEIDDVGDVGRLQDGDVDAFEDAVGRVRKDRGVSDVVVAGDREHPTMLVRAHGVGTAERIAAAIDAGSLAIPEAEHAIDALAGKQVELLGAPQHRGGEIFIEAGLEADPRRAEQLLAPPHFLIDAAKRGAAIAGNQSASVQTSFSIQPRLFE